MGYPPDYVWPLTPKRIEAFLFFARKRRNAELLELLKIQQIARSSDERTVKDFIKALQQ